MERPEGNALESFGINFQTGPQSKKQLNSSIAY